MSGAGGALSSGSAAAGGVLLDQAEHRGRQVAVGRPYNTNNTAGGEWGSLTLSSRVGLDVL